MAKESCSNRVILSKTFTDESRIKFIEQETHQLHKKISSLGLFLLDYECGVFATHMPTLINTMQDKVLEAVTYYLESELKSTLKSLYPATVLANFTDEERKDLIEEIVNTFVESDNYNTLLTKVLERLQPKPESELDLSSEQSQEESPFLLKSVPATNTPSHLVAQLEKMNFWDLQYQKSTFPLFLEVLGQRPLVGRVLHLLQYGYQVAPTFTWTFLLHLLVKSVLQKPKTKKFTMVNLDAKQSDTAGWQLTKLKFEFLHHLLIDLQTHWPRLPHPLDPMITELSYQLLCQSESFAWLHFLDSKFTFLFSMLSTAPGKKLWLSSLKLKIPTPLFYGLGTFQLGRDWLQKHHLDKPTAIFACVSIQDEKKWLETCLSKAREREEVQTVEWFLNLKKKPPYV